MEHLIRYEAVGKVARITMADPSCLNALTYPMSQQFNAALDRAEAEARAVVLTGDGRAFSSGGSVDQMDNWPADSLRLILNPLITRLRDLSIPLVTSVNGVAVGIAASIALMGDIVLASEKSFFLLAFGQIGLVPDGNASYILPRLIGRARTMELMLLGDRLSPQQALDWGMINRIVAPEALQDEAMAFAERLASGPASIARTRRLIWQSFDNDWQSQLDAEADEQEQAQASADYREGISAFLAKRPPVFTGS